MDTVSTIGSLLQTTQSGYSTNSTKSGGLGIDDFLKLLVAQMQNLDVSGADSSGNNGTEYVTQLAQFTMLEQLSALKSELSTGNACSLIGKYVYIEGSDSAKQIYGRVEGVMTVNGEKCVVVGGKAYELSRITAVEDRSSDDLLLRSAAFIGKQVTAKYKEQDGTETAVTGTVEKITVENGAIYLVIDGKSVPLSGVTEITAANAQQ